MLSATVNDIVTQLTNTKQYERVDYGFYFPTLELVNKKIYIAVVARNADGEINVNNTQETQSISIMIFFKDESKYLSKKLEMLDTIENNIISAVSGYMLGEKYKITRQSTFSDYGIRETPIDPFYSSKIDIDVITYS